MKDYDYYKTKYKSITLRLDREADTDVIKFLEEWPKGPKHAIMLAVRIFKAALRRGLS